MTVFSLVSCVAAVHGIRAAMASLKKTGTDFPSAKGMETKVFFEVMGTHYDISVDPRTRVLTFLCRPECGGHTRCTGLPAPLSTIPMP